MSRFNVMPRATRVYLEDNTCTCGQPIVTIDYDTSRSITNLATDRTEAPLTLHCADGHTTTEWCEYDIAIGVIQRHAKDNP